MKDDRIVIGVVGPSTGMKKSRDDTVEERAHKEALTHVAGEIGKLITTEGQILLTGGDAALWPHKANQRRRDGRREECGHRR